MNALNDCFIFILMSQILAKTLKFSIEVFNRFSHDYFVVSFLWVDKRFFYNVKTSTAIK